MSGLIKKYKWILLLFIVGVVLRTLYALCVNFNEPTMIYEDYTQIYLLGLKYYTTKVWPYWGPDITYTASQIPGALQGLLVGLPFYIWESPEAPIVFLNILTALSLLFLGWYSSKKITGIPKWVIYGCLFLSPWTMHYGTTTFNPSYVLAPAILFFVCIIDVSPIYPKKIVPTWLSYVMIGLSLGWIMQLHMSWVLLPFYMLIQLFFLLKTKDFYKIAHAFLFFGLGFFLSILTLIPTIIKYQYVLNAIESVIVFNPSNFKNIDIITRFISFSTMETLFFSGSWKGIKDMCLNNLWAAPFICLLTITGIVQLIYYLSFFLRKTNRPEFKYIKILTIASILLVYISYLFAIRDVSNYTFFLMYPVAFLFSLFCLEKLFEKKIWKTISAFILLSSVIFHLILAKENFKEKSLYSKKNKIENALAQKDSRLFAPRRVANWEKLEQDKAWEFSVINNSMRNALQYVNNFDKYPPEITPETLNYNTFYSKPYSCQVDTGNTVSQYLLVDPNTIKEKTKVTVSMAVFSDKINDCLLVITVDKIDSNLFWTGTDIAKDEKYIGKWKQLSITKEIPIITDSNALIKVMTWLPNEKIDAKVLVDDVKIIFE